MVSTPSLLDGEATSTMKAPHQQPLPMVRTATTMPTRCRTSARTAARLQSAKSSPNSSGICWRISAWTSASCLAVSRLPCPSAGPRGLLFSPARPRSAKRLQMSKARSGAARPGPRSPHRSAPPGAAQSPAASAPIARPPSGSACLRASWFRLFGNSRRIPQEHWSWLNNIVEQDHRCVKRLVRPGLGFGGFWTAPRTLAGYEVMAMARKGQVRSVGGRDMRAQARFVAELFHIAA